MDLSKLTDDELLKLKSTLETEVATLDNQQMAIKILMNSLYGALGNQFFRFFRLKTAEAITLYGQLAIRWAGKAVNTYLNELLKTDEDYIAYTDTDSLYVNFEPIVKIFNLESLPEDKITDTLSKIAKDKIEPVISKAYDELAEYMQAYSNKMVMKREVVASSAAFIAKKRYFMRVLDSEGVRFKEPKIKIMGIEAVKSSTPESCRDALRSIFNVILTSTEEETVQFINDFKDKFYSLPAEAIAFPRGVNDITKWEDSRTLYKGGTPIHVRASILHNQLLKQHPIPNIQPIQNGDKIKFLYLKLPNPIKENVFAFTEYMPKEFKLDKYIDYDLQYEKTFLSVIEPIAETIGWNISNSNSLESFFC